MSVVLGGVKQEVPGLVTTSWLDSNPDVAYVTDKGPRTRAIRAIVAHTHEGKSGLLLPGMGPHTPMAVRLAMYQNQTDRYTSWDFTVDSNGDVLWQNDPLKTFTWHASNPDVNSVALGFEMVQKIHLEPGSATKIASGDLYEGQIQKVVEFLDFLTAKLGIQRQILWDKKKDKPCDQVVLRVTREDTGGTSGANVVGIYGHRNVTHNRGIGDPGDALFYALKAAGYECFDPSDVIAHGGEDLKVWKERQKALGLSDKDCDGIPLTKTLEALKAKGTTHTQKTFGVWVTRPMDAML